jgi:hypothetical protein
MNEQELLNGSRLGPIDLCCMIFQQSVRNLYNEVQLKSRNLHEIELT